MRPVAPTSTCPAASATAMGPAAWKNTSSGSIPNSRKKPFSTPTKIGAEEMSLRTPTLTLSAGSAPVASSISASAASARIRPMTPPGNG